VTVVTSVKEKIVKVVKDLPEKTSIDEAMDKLYLLSKIEKGIAQADNGQTVSHVQAKRRMKRWSK
jgi:DNA polymerase elongation subunit (family B)